MGAWKKEYLDLLSGSRPQEVVTLKNRNLPKKIYKYRSVTTESLENLKNDTVWLCSPGRYNDPYDSAITINLNRLFKFVLLNKPSYFSTQEELNLTADEMELIRKSSDPISTLVELLYRKKIPPLLKLLTAESDEFIKKAVIIAKETFANSFEELNRTIMHTFHRMIKVCSFSATKSSMLMWTHYAKNHEGFCVEYNLGTLDENDERKVMLFPVIYSDKLCDVTDVVELMLILEDDLSASSKALERIINEMASGKELTADPAKIKAVTEKFKLDNLLAFSFKSKEWQYEQEWRLVKIAKSPNPGPEPDYNYEMPTPSAIYVGAKMSEENKALISAIASKKNIDVFQMALSGQEFKLVEKQLGETDLKIGKEMEEKFEKLVSELHKDILDSGR